MTDHFDRSLLAEESSASRIDLSTSRPRLGHRPPRLSVRGRQSSMFAGTFPPCAASSFITRSCNQMVIAAESAVSPV